MCLALVAVEMWCGKLRLRHTVDSGPVFAVKKPTGRLSEIRKGGEVSEAALALPAPRRLGNPSVFVDIVARQGERLVYSKRNAMTSFDILICPHDISAFFGRPKQSMM